MLIIIQKAQSHISTVFGQFSQLNSFLQLEIYPPGKNKTKPIIEPPTSAFFLAETHVCSDFQTVMSELQSLIKNLSDRFDALQSDLDKLK